MTMQKGTSYSLKLYQDNISGRVTWKSSDKKTAVVNSKGKVTAKKTGTVTITARADGHKAICKIKVVNARLNASQISIVKGKAYTLDIIGTSQKPVWSSSKPSIASVSRKGKITAKKKGTAVITATIDSISLDCKVTVTYPIWSKLKDQYKDKRGVKQLLFVKYTGGTRAKKVIRKCKEV